MYSAPQIWTRLIIFDLVLLISLTTLAQKDADIAPIPSVTIEECYEWVRENYPLIQQIDIIDKTTQYSLSNASNGNLPQISLNGQATYQSEVTQLPINIPNMEIPTIDKDQYKVYGEVYQPLTNFSNVNARKRLIAQRGEIDKQQLEIDLYKLKDRINQIYFGALLINEKIEQFKIIQTDLDSALIKVEAAIRNGMATTTDKQLLQVERISLDQQIEENKANQKAFLTMLASLTQKNITEETKLSKPRFQVLQTNINRPEIRLFSLQNQSIDLQKKQINNSLIPNLGLFGQAGYGRPALNFLSNEFEFYYLGGIKLNWNLSSFYNYKNSLHTLDLTREKINSMKEAFLLNISLTQTQQSAEVSKYSSLLKSDLEIIQIREEVLKTAQVQLNNGLITTIDYVKILNDVNRAKQMQLLHETQLLLAQHNLKNTTGN